MQNYFMHLSFTFQRIQIINQKDDKSFYICPCIYLYQSSLVLHTALSYCLVYFHFNLKSSHQHFFQGRSNSNKHSALVYLKMSNFSFLKDIVAKSRTQQTAFFSFCTFSMSLNCLLITVVFFFFFLLTTIVFIESSIDLIGDPLYMTNHLLLHSKFSNCFQFSTI